MWGVILATSLAGVGVAFFLKRKQAKKQERQKKQYEALSRQLQETERSLRSVFDATLEGIIVHHRGIILDANKAALNSLNIKFHALMGLEFDIFLDDKSPGKIEEILHSNTLTRRVTLIKTTAGEQKLVELSCRPYEFRGHPVHLISIQELTLEKNIYKKRLQELENLKESAPDDRIIVCKSAISSASKS